MKQIDLCKFKLLPERGHPHQVRRFRKSGVLCVQAIAPDGVLRQKRMTGWLELNRSTETAWFFKEADDQPEQRLPKGCSFAAVMFTIAMLVMLFVDEHCDGLFSPDAPQCADDNVWILPAIPFGIAVIASIWGLRHPMPGPRFRNAEAKVKLPGDLWALLVPFGEAIEQAKASGDAPLGERAFRKGAEVVVEKVGELVSGPMLGGALGALTGELTNDKEARIEKALENLRERMLDSVLRYCKVV